jgi:Kef-type K+ transport system membrane component KefB
MGKVWGYSVLLIVGLFASQIIDLSTVVIPFGSVNLEGKSVIEAITLICMAYIMLEVGLEFSIDKKNLKQYGGDFCVAVGAAVIPWAFVAIYFFCFFSDSWQETILLGGFAAPTSAGILFTMLAAARLSASWVFKKARVLAIFDDLATILLMVPAQMFIRGWSPMMIWSILLMGIFLLLAYKNMHRFKFPVKPGAMLFYGVIIWIVTHKLEANYHIHLGVLLPAFCLGLVAKFQHKEGIVEHEKNSSLDLDHWIKVVFMLGVGLAMPKMQFGEININRLLLHVLAITVISNLGKCFIVLCYHKVAHIKDRLALSFAMFPRGEVGAGILLIALAYGNDSITTTISGISLGLNLLLTGVFIYFVKKFMTETVSEL